MSIDLSFLSSLTLVIMLSKADNVFDIWELDDLLLKRHPRLWPIISRWFL